MAPHSMPLVLRRCHAAHEAPEYRVLCDGVPVGRIIYAIRADGRCWGWAVHALLLDAEGRPGYRMDTSGASHSKAEAMADFREKWESLTPDMERTREMAEKAAERLAAWERNSGRRGLHSD